MSHPSVLEEFDWKRAGDLTLCKPETLKANAARDIETILRYIQNENWESHFITTHYGQFNLKVSGEVTATEREPKPMKYVAITIEMVALRASAITEVDA